MNTRVHQLLLYKLVIIVNFVAFINTSKAKRGVWLAHENKGHAYVAVLNALYYMYNPLSRYVDIRRILTLSIPLLTNNVFNYTRAPCKTAYRHNLYWSLIYFCGFSFVLIYTLVYSYITVVVVPHYISSFLVLQYCNLHFSCLFF